MNVFYALCTHILILEELNANLINVILIFKFWLKMELVLHAPFISIPAATRSYV